jgi:hypothetical protein
MLRVKHSDELWAVLSNTDLAFATDGEAISIDTDTPAATLATLREMVSVVEEFSQ